MGLNGTALLLSNISRLHGNFVNCLPSKKILLPFCVIDLLAINIGVGVHILIKWIKYRNIKAYKIIDIAGYKRHLFHRSRGGYHRINHRARMTESLILTTNPPPFPCYRH